MFDEVEVETIVQPAVQRLHRRLHTGFGARQVRDAVERTGQDYACIIHDPESGGYGLRYQELRRCWYARSSNCMKASRFWKVCAIRDVDRWQPLALRLSGGCAIASRLSRNDG
ncbi:hypothetical protein [Azospirillum melinis]|uniref:hypothetical protein n=1 Tax=Azospirillum melinis TaxID=328839 RepID=UPI00157BADC0|nr:hypothetical protein [Azospirillum melinis]MBP2307474.1 hypothetical protein [Azospirillum melinis]